MAIQVNGNTVIDNTQNITNVNSYSGDGVATQQEAEDGTNNDQLMTPLRVLDSIKKNGGGGMIDKIQEDLELVGPLPTEGAWEWNDSPGYTPGVLGDGGNISGSAGPQGVKLKSHYGSAVGNQLSTFRSILSSDDSGSGSIQRGAVGFGSPPTVSMRQESNSNFDNYAAFGGTILLVSTPGPNPRLGLGPEVIDLNWKRVYNLSINAPTKSDLDSGTPSISAVGSSSNYNCLNFSRLESANGLFGFNFMDRNLDPQVRWPSSDSYFFYAHLKFPELETIDSIRPVFTWTQNGENFPTTGITWSPCSLKLDFPKLDIESLNKVILGIDGPDITWTRRTDIFDPSSVSSAELDIAITIETPHSLSDLSTEARAHWNSLKNRFTTSGL